MDTIESSVQSSLKDPEIIPIICINGSPSTGKSTLATEACKGLSSKEWGIVWFDCERNFITDFKVFCGKQELVPNKLIFVFDNLDSKDEGSFKLLINVFRNTDEKESSISPSCIIVTSRQPISLHEPCVNLPLGYEWITSSLNQFTAISLPTFMENVLNDAMKKKDQATNETAKTLVDIFERLHSLLSVKCKFIDVFNASLNLILLGGCLKCDDDVKVESLNLFLSKMTNLSPEFCTKVLTIFGDGGLLRIYSSWDGEQEKQQQQCISLFRLCSFSQQFILRHEMVQFVFKTQFGFSEPEDNFKIATHSRFLKAWKEIRFQGDDELVEDIYSALFPQIAEALVLNYEIFEEEYLYELFQIAKDFGSDETIESFFKR